MDDRLKKIVDSAHGPVEFKHDAFGNLQGALYADFQSLLRMPDAVGNLFRTSDRKDRKYGPSGQLLEATDATGTTRYEYDAEGNLVLKTMPDATQWRYRWNAAGHLEEVLRPDGLTVRFEYDPLGRRIAKSFAGRTTRWVWDGNLPLHEWTDDRGQDLSNSDIGTSALPDARLHGILQDLHAQTLSPVVSQGPPPTLEAPLTWLFEPDTFAPMARLQGDARQSILCDHLGTPLEMYDAQGQRIWAAELDIYGNVRTHSGNRSLCPFRYPGQYEDLETGLHYNRFRYYDPQAGAYISQDPIGLAGGNPTLYGYVGDPNGWVDPWGLAKECGRTGKQKRLRDLEDDPKQPKWVRGWIKNERRRIKQKGKGNIRLPGNSRKSKSGGKVLAHKRGARAKDGHSYAESVLQDTDLHLLEHKFEGY